MIKLAEIRESKTGRKKIEFFQLGIYDLLKNHLGFRYTKINKKGYYLKLNIDGMFEVVNFLKLSEAFREYISTEFENISELKGVTYNEFMNEYYSKRPIKNGNYCREYLSEDFELSPENLHEVLMKIDYNYMVANKTKNILEFLKEENFEETIDSIGNFALQKPLFYKRLSKNQFLVFNQPFIDIKTNDSVFDFWSVNADSEEKFLQKKLNEKDLIDLRLGFDLGRDIKLYSEKITCANTLV